MVELVRDLRVINVLAKFENDLWKIMDVRVLTVIFHVRSWKMPKKIAKIWRLWKNPEHILINMFRPTYVPNLVTLAWKMSSGMWKIMDVRVLTGLVCPAARPLGVRQHPGALKGCGVKSIGGIHHKIPWLFPDFPIFKDFPWLFTEFPEFSLTLKNINFPWLFPDRWQPWHGYVEALAWVGTGPGFSWTSPHTNSIKIEMVAACLVPSSMTLNLDVPR